MTTKRTEELLKADIEHVIHPYNSYAPLGRNWGIVFDSAHGVTLVDTEGKEYLDLSSQLVSQNLGHGRKEIQDAITDAIHKIDYTTLYYGFTNPYSVECARKLAGLTPGTLNHFYFTCGGSESTDSAVKIARFYQHCRGKKGKYKIISLYNGYHGETGISTYVSGIGRGAVQNPFGPTPGGFVRIPPFYCYRCMLGHKYPDCNTRCAYLLNDVIEAEGEESVAAFIAEPLTGTAGFFEPPVEWWPIVSEICEKHDVLLIADEVMTGFARTGKMFAQEHWGIKADMMTMAKGLTSCYLPLGAVAVNDTVWDVIKNKMLVHGMTYSGHPICCAASIACMDIYVKEKVADNAAKVGKHLRERLDTEFLPLPCVGNISGKGMMQAVEFVNDKKSKAVLAPDVREELIEKVLANGLFTRITGALGNQMFISPPCVSTVEEVNKMLDILLPLVAELKPK